MSSGWVIECVDYWCSRVDESEIGVDWADARERCWRCGANRKLQKCHIVAKQFGGTTSPDNLVALCSQCHDEQPDVIDPGEVWRWIAETKPKYGYGTLWIERALAIAQSRGVDISRFDVDAFNRITESSVGLHLMQHGGGARIKTSTWAWAIEQACKEATDGQNT